MSPFIVYQFYFHISYPMKNKVFQLTLLKAEEKIKNFQNIFDKKIAFALKCSNQSAKI